MELFGFLLKVIGLLDEPGRNYSLFPLLFLLEYSKYIGFSPVNNQDELNPYFDLREGKFVKTFPGFENGLDIDESMLLSQVLKCKIADEITPLLNSQN